MFVHVTLVCAASRVTLPFKKTSTRGITIYRVQFGQRLGSEVFNGR